MNKMEIGGQSLPPERSENSRKRLIEEWRIAEEKVIKYSGGSVANPDGTIYDYPAGSRLLIGSGKKAEQVMDSCETPWAFGTVDRAFAEFPQNGKPTKILERGFGMGITARRAIHHLITRGGEYTVIELNQGNANYAREWIKKQKSAFSSMASGMPDTKPDIEINLIEGEASEETATLAKENRKFDIIISDTYPLDQNEQGMNDLRDLEILKNCLSPEGIFVFFAYFPGSTGGVVKTQENMIVKHFRNYSVSSAEITPPPSYKYLQTPNGPVRNLPIVICQNPIFS